MRRTARTIASSEQDNEYTTAKRTTIGISTLTGLLVVAAIVGISIWLSIRDDAS